MKKIILVLFMMLGLLFFVSCEKNNNANEPTACKEVNEEQWNNSVKDYAFAKDKDTKLIIKVYSSPDEENKPDFVLYKDGLVYKFVTISSGYEFVSYGDFENNVSYRYYGIDRSNYYKSDKVGTIEENFSQIVYDFNTDFNKVKFEKDEYVSTIPYEGKEKYGHYSFLDGALKEFKIYFENELDYKMTIEPLNNNIVLPNGSYIDNMPTNEMKIYIREALKELKSYNAIGADYSVEAYEHYTVATFEYLRYKNSDDTYKTLEQLLGDIKSNLVDHFFSNRVEVIDQVDSLDEYIWFGKFKNGNQNGLVIKLVPGSSAVDVVFAVVDYDVLNILALKEYLENRLVEDVEEDEFFFDGTAMIDNKDCLLIQYSTSMTGTLDDLVAYANTCVKDNGYEWTESGSSSNYHYEILEFDNKAVRLYYTPNDDNGYDIKITFCVSFGDDDPSLIINYGIKSPLFE